jgi:hypothetical protein
MTLTVQSVMNPELLHDFSSALEHTKLRNSETVGFVLLVLYLLHQQVYEEIDYYFASHICIFIMVSLFMLVFPFL